MSVTFTLKADIEKAAENFTISETKLQYFIIIFQNKKIPSSDILA
jgi:hypothetical protein